MKIRLKTIPTSKVTMKQRKAFSKLRLKYGELYPLLIKSLKNPKAKVSYAVNSRGKIIGWALLTNNALDLDDNDFDTSFIIELFVAKQYRRRGIGSKIFNSLKRHCKRNVQVIPWNEESTKFFAKHKSKITKYCRYDIEESLYYDDFG